MYVDSNKPLDREGVHTRVLKYRRFLPLLCLLIWIICLCSIFPPRKVDSKRKRAKIKLQMFVSDNRYRIYAASELHLLLCNWINVFEVALIYFIHPLLLSGPSGTVPISAVSQMLGALRCSKTSSNKQQFLGHWNTMILCCFLSTSI